MLYFVVKVKTQVCFYSSYNVPCPWGPAWRSAARLVSALGQRESASSPLHARRCMRPPFLVFLHSGLTHQRMIERALVNQLIGLTDTRKWFIQSFIVKPSFSFFSAAEARPRESLGHRVAEPTFSLFLLSGEDLYCPDGQMNGESYRLSFTREEQQLTGYLVNSGCLAVFFSSIKP